ncbi:Pentatricopeptide repeat [Trema orientale]|uniref:Pentatricopeptide repeat n=1 Tax=Trema orientale TaxID=63057 RepID=A0A2P5E7R5_TREOI|nr:Pentatricopeptide repeat [Trema orientale]
MAIGTTKLWKSLMPFSHGLLQYRFLNSLPSMQMLQETIKEVVELKTYQKIPDLLTSFEQARRNPNPFSFLSTFPQIIRTRIVDEILQSFIPLRPRSRPQNAYACLLSYTLQSPNPLPLSLAILQQTLRSGCVPVPQTHLLLSSAWLEHRHCESHSIQNILLEMKSIGYHPDCGTCNYLISSLCAVDQLTEAVKVLKGMAGAGCVPDSESYDTVIKAMCKVRRTAEALDMIKQMVEKVGLTPRQGTLVKVAAALRANREMWRAVEMIEFLEREGHIIGFESYELVVEGCLECGEYILAGKVVIGMTEKGLLPYIGVRQKLVERLAGIGEWKLACAVRQRFVELQS